MVKVDESTRWEQALVPKKGGGIKSVTRKNICRKGEGGRHTHLACDSDLTIDLNPRKAGRRVSDGPGSSSMPERDAP